MTGVEEAAARSRPDRSFKETVRGIAWSLRDRRDDGPMSRGDRAELRRMREGDVFAPSAFWSLVERYDVGPRDEAFWRAMIPLMVDHPHNSKLPAGRALARARVSPARLEQWLRRDRDRARAEAGRLLKRLDEGLDWVGFARLLRWWDDSDKLGFARDFFLSPEFRERKRQLAAKGD